jgi:hypothetical protein
MEKFEKQSDKIQNRVTEDTQEKRIPRSNFMYQNFDCKRCKTKESMMGQFSGWLVFEDF